MSTDIIAPLLSGTFALIGGLGGVLLTSHLNVRAQASKQSAEDARRWLADRRQIYAHYLSLSEVMLREADSVAVFLSYDGSEPVSDEDKTQLSEGLFEYLMKWDDELQPALFEVQLVASPAVADLADRVSGALMTLTVDIKSVSTFNNYYPAWFQAKDMLQVLRNAMRSELGLPRLEDAPFPRERDWPWLADRPARSSYVQQHPARSNGPTGSEE